MDGEGWAEKPSVRPWEEDDEGGMYSEAGKKGAHVLLTVEAEVEEGGGG